MTFTIPQNVENMELENIHTVCSSMVLAFFYRRKALITDVSTFVRVIRAVFTQHVLWIWQSRHPTHSKIIYSSTPACIAVRLSMKQYGTSSKVRQRQKNKNSAVLPSSKQLITYFDKIKDWKPRNTIHNVKKTTNQQNKAYRYSEKTTSYLQRTQVYFLFLLSITRPLLLPIVLVRVKLLPAPVTLPLLWCCCTWCFSWVVCLHL